METLGTSARAAGWKASGLGHCGWGITVRSTTVDGGSQSDIGLPPSFSFQMLEYLSEAPPSLSGVSSSFSVHRSWGALSVTDSNSGD